MGVISELPELITPVCDLIDNMGEPEDGYHPSVNMDYRPDQLGILINLGEEVGDILWYLSIIASSLNGFINKRVIEEKRKPITLGTLAQANIAKLKSRYGDKFTEVGANIRSLHGELKTLKDYILL